MKTFKLAYRNLIGAGLRTWLNVFVLSLTFVVIIAHKGLLDGWDKQAQFDMINWDVAGGQLWHNSYDPYDPFTINESHGRMSPEILQAKTDSMLTPILFTQGSIYPEGRMQNAMIKGIDPDQSIIHIPSDKLKTDSQMLPAIIGTRMAKSNKLKEGDFLTIRWRDVNGTFDATEVQISGIFKTNVPLVDVGTIYIPLNDLQDMMLLPDEASIVIMKEGTVIEAGEEFILRDKEYLLKEVKEMIQSKSAGGAIIYIMLLLLAMLAIFDTQVLSVFRRQKEIGTFIAMGMTRGEVIRMFTLEGAMYGFFALVLAAIYGTPLLMKFREVGFEMPASTDDFGLAVAESIIPYYSAGLIIVTVIVVLLTTTLVSFMPVRKIAKMKPTDAIKGKLQ